MGNPLARSSSKEVRIRVSDFFSVVDFSREILAPKKGKRALCTGGPSVGRWERPKPCVKLDVFTFEPHP